MADETYWPNGHITGSTERNGVTTLSLKAEGRDGVERTAMLVEHRDQGIERHILPLMRRVGRGRYAALEDALQRGAIPGAVARDLHRLLRDAEDEVASAKRSGRMDVMRGRFH